MTTRTRSWLTLLKDYWWLATVIGGALVLWGNLPMRTTKLEAGQAKQQEDIVDLKGVAGKLDGYIAAQQQLNERLANQQSQALTPNAPMTEEVSDDGEVKVMVWTDEHGMRKKMCCQGRTCWTWHKTTQCQR